MRVSGISLVTLHAEGEIFAFCAIEAVHLLRNWLHAPITAEPEVITIVKQLILCSVLSFACNALSHLVLIVLLKLLVVF